MLDFLASGPAGAAPPVWITWLPIVGMIAIFWFLLIRPQMRQQKVHREKIGGLKKGDQVVTAGGLVAKVLKLQQAGLIRYARGRITVLDRAGLEERTCECYAVVKREYDRMLPDLAVAGVPVR